MRLPLVPIKINGRSLESQLKKLLELDNTRSLVRQNILNTGAVIIGGIAVHIYFKPTKIVTEGEFYQPVAITTTMSTNGVLNIFFNIAVVTGAIFLKDPITGELTIPRWVLATSIPLSILSAFPFAFLDWEQDLQSEANFFIKMVVYACQHIYFFLALLDKIQTKYCDKTSPKSLKAKSEALTAIDTALFQLNRRFYLNISEEDGVIPRDGHLDPTHYFRNGKLNMDCLLNDINRREDDWVLPTQPKGNRATYFSYLLAQLFGSLAPTIISNIGYQVSTINSFQKKFGLDFYSSVSLGILAMIPSYGLGLITSYENFGGLLGLCLLLIRKSICASKSSEILDEIPFAVKRTPYFSFAVGSLFTFSASLSFFTALYLLNEAIVGNDPENPPLASWLNISKGFVTLLRAFGIVGVIFANGYPGAAVVEYAARKYCIWFGTEKDKAAVKTLEALATLRKRVDGIPADAFHYATDKAPPARRVEVVKEVRVVQEPEPEPAESRSSNCTSCLTRAAGRIKNAVSGCYSAFFGRKTPAPQPHQVPLLPRESQPGIQRDRQGSIDPELEIETLVAQQEEKELGPTLEYIETLEILEGQYEMSQQALEEMARKEYNEKLTVSKQALQDVLKRQKAKAQQKIQEKMALETETLVVLP